MTTRPHRSLAPPLTAAYALVMLAGCSGMGGHQIPEPPSAPTACAGLKGLQIPAAAIGLPTRGALVTEAVVVAAAGTGAAAVPAYCRVLGEILPVNAAAPSIRLQVNLPAGWNGKTLMFGGGGYNGTIATGVGNVPAGPADQPLPLARGYATFGSDSGHQAGPAASRDGSFGANEEALRNFAGDALKKTRDVATIVVQHHYARKPQRRYFAGGSTGGREALIAVGTWPQDFDGAIVLYPAWNATALNLHLGRVTQALAQSNAYPSRAQRKLVFDAALQACDALDTSSMA